LDEDDVSASFCKGQCHSLANSPGSTGNYSLAAFQRKESVEIVRHCYKELEDTRNENGLRLVVWSRVEQKFTRLKLGP
jgi:hypothetical protein